jgi:hypothetical protein
MFSIAVIPSNIQDERQVELLFPVPGTGIYDIRTKKSEANSKTVFLGSKERSLKIFTVGRGSLDMIT